MRNRWSRWVNKSTSSWLSYFVGFDDTCRPLIALDSSRAVMTEVREDEDDLMGLLIRLLPLVVPLVVVLVVLMALVLFILLMVLLLPPLVVLTLVMVLVLVLILMVVLLLCVRLFFPFATLPEVTATAAAAAVALTPC